MLNQFIKAIKSFATKQASKYAAVTAFMRDLANGFMTTAHHTLMIFGVAAITVLAMTHFKPEFINDLKTYSPFTPTIVENTTTVSSQLGSLMDTPGNTLGKADAVHLTLVSDIRGKSAFPSHQQQLLVSEWLSKRYRVAGDATYMLVSAAYLTAEENKLDPLLILAVIAIESGFNPYAESPVGAQGLMQVMSKLHREKFEDLGGIKAALNPVANIKVGSMILKEYVKRGGSVEAGLKLYVGAAAFETDFGYGAKVLNEYQRLKEVSLGRKVPAFTTNANKAAPKPEAIESMNDEQKTILPSENKSISSKSDFLLTDKFAHLG